MLYHDTVLLYTQWHMYGFHFFEALLKDGKKAGDGKSNWKYEWTYF